MADLGALRLLVSGVTRWNADRPAGPVDLTGIEIWNANLAGADLRQADLNHARIYGSDLSGCLLARARLNGVTCERTRIDDADLTGAEFKGASLWRVCLCRAVLVAVQTVDVRIRDSVIVNADLAGAEFAGSHMHNCDLTGIVLTDAMFEGAFLKRITAAPGLLAELGERGARLALPNEPLTADRVDCAQLTVNVSDDDFGLIVHGGHAYWMGGHRWDFFISHASQDKQAVAAPLTRALEAHGQRVWLDVHQLVAGDSLEERIGFGIDGCRFGVVVLSERFFHRYWTERELGELFARRKRIFVVLHKVDRARLESEYKVLRDLVTISTDSGIQAVADHLMDAVRRPPRHLTVD